MSTDYVFDPFAEGFAADPYPEYSRLREAGPVHAHPFGFHVVSSYDEVATLLRSGLSVEERNAAPSALSDFQQEAYGDRNERMDGLSMLDKDPPDHTRLRRLVSKAFTPRSIAALEPRIVALVDEALDAIDAAGSVDLVDALAFPLPFQVISEMMGMPEADHVRLRELSGLVVRSLEPLVDPEVIAAVIKADDELQQIAREAIAWKRERPSEDLLSALIAAEDGGDVLNDDELVAQVLLLYIAGHETTVNLIAGGVLALLRHPEQLEQLRAWPELLENAVEELLRFDPPVQMSRRITTAPYALAGHELPAGSFVIASLASANRDPAYWGQDAADLRLDRPNARQHVSFGAGVHHCLARRWHASRASRRSAGWWPASRTLPSTATSPGTGGSTCAARSTFRSGCTDPIRSKCLAFAIVPLALNAFTGQQMQHCPGGGMADALA